jgi:hypothetical protein
MDWLPRLEIFCLDLGLLFSLYTAYRVALACTPDLSHALKALAPWAVLLLVLFASGIWIGCNRCKCAAPYFWGDSDGAALLVGADSAVGMSDARRG